MSRASRKLFIRGRLPKRERERAARPTTPPSLLSLSSERWKRLCKYWRLDTRSQRIGQIAFRPRVAAKWSSKLTSLTLFREGAQAHGPDIALLIFGDHQAHGPDIALLIFGDHQAHGPDIALLIFGDHQQQQT
ncbi:hypothetical protein AVEN_192960-1 [Araneus ventricosus]|uniref:Uncharacterized protein n=1 Tax=Araneus ventricosus TaxID=182803 RepID=A0A4Y2TB59_ARAVE|nr:hypothetical protein AVEN_192960-1 [Araneus ventricosus]